MAITAYTTARLEDVTTVRVTSDLTGTVYYHWYLDGEYLGRTTEPERALQLDAGDQARLDVIDTTDADYDGLANSPEGYPARRTLCWIRSLDTSAAEYRVDQQQDGGAWAEVARLPVEPGRWQYRWTTERLDDLSSYAWRIVPLDAAGNAGTATTIGPELVVRRPDAPTFAVTLNVDTTVTVA